MNKYKVILKDSREIIVQTDNTPGWNWEYTIKEDCLTFGSDAQFPRSEIIGYTKIP